MDVLFVDIRVELGMPLRIGHSEHVLRARTAHIHLVRLGPGLGSGLEPGQCEHVLASVSNVHLLVRLRGEAERVLRDELLVHELLHALVALALLARVRVRVRVRVKVEW